MHTHIFIPVTHIFYCVFYCNNNDSYDDYEIVYLRCVYI